MKLKKLKIKIEPRQWIKIGNILLGISFGGILILTIAKIVIGF